MKQEFTDGGRQRLLRRAAVFAGRLASSMPPSRSDASSSRTSAPDGTLTLDRFLDALPRSPFAFPGREDGNPYPGGLALSEDGRTLYVVLSRNNTLAVLDLDTRTVVKQIPVGNAPHAVVVRGNKAYVSNQGGRRATSRDFTNDSSGTPIVADPRTGIAEHRERVRGGPGRRCGGEDDRGRAAADRSAPGRRAPLRGEHERGHRVGDRRRARPPRPEHTRGAVPGRALRQLAQRAGVARRPALREPRPQQRARGLSRRHGGLQPAVVPGPRAHGLVPQRPGRRSGLGPA